jgi:hypothetical protein
MSKEAQERGLCMTCNNHPGCTFAANREKPVWQCEEFCCDAASSLKTENIDQPLQPSMPTIVDDDTAEFAGLCRDCENRHDCALRKRAGGVWQCEEYRQDERQREIVGAQ